MLGAKLLSVTRNTVGSVSELCDQCLISVRPGINMMSKRLQHRLNTRPTHVKQFGKIVKNSFKLHHCVHASNYSNILG